MKFLCLFPLLLLPALFGQDKPQLPDAPGKEVTQRLCSKCHGVQLMLGKPHSEEGWGAIVADMVQRGAEGTDDELYEVVQYLTKNIKALPKINVNKADAKTLETGLSLSAKEAEALIAAREKSEFKSIDDLKKVAGIDPAKIEAKKGLLTF
jgi:competence protein ComEA